MRILVHTWLVVETVGDVDLEEGILPMGPGSLGKGCGQIGVLKGKVEIWIKGE